MFNRVPQAQSGPALITGGAGFLGRHLAARMDAAGFQVTVLDDLSCVNSTFDCVALRSERIAKVKGSVFDRPLVEALVARNPLVVHFASVVGVEETVSHTIPTIENLNGTINVVRALTRDHVAVFGSSADVYGAHSHLYDRAMREDDLFVYENGRVNRWVYPHVKTLEENLFHNSAARTAIVRIFNSYGPEMDYPAPKRVIPHFIDCILGKRPLLLSGDGSQRRSFCFVDDMTEGFLRIVAYAGSESARRNDCFNIGHPEPISMRDLAAVMIDAARDLGMIRKPLPIIADGFTYSQSFDDRWNRTPDIAHAQEVLGFAPEVHLREGLRRTLSFYRALQRSRKSTRLRSALPTGDTRPGAPTVGAQAAD